MAKKPTSPTSAPERPALLLKPREEVRAQLLARVEVAKEFANTQIHSVDSFEALKAAYDRWTEFNSEFLRRAFTSDEYAKEYNWFGIIAMSMGRPSLQEKAHDLAKNIVEKRDRLISLIERLDLIDEAPDVATERAISVAQQPAAMSASPKVFVVHGQDDEAKAVVARFISGCGLEPIILHEQPSGGRTIIEKFEQEADVGFAVIILTPDDVGGVRAGESLTSDTLKARARQNVILELGYFAGRFSRGRVAALKKGDVELPSDIAGVVWTAMDASDAWKVSLARELKAAGYEFDVAKALGI